MIARTDTRAASPTIPAPRRGRVGAEAGIHRQAPRENGFTLLELLISMTLFLLVIVILGGALRLGFRSISAAERKMDVLERYRTSRSIVMAQLQSSAPLTYDDQDGARKLYLKGDAANLQFATNQSIWGGERGCVIVSYRLETGSDGTLILYASERSAGREEVQETRLFDDLKTLSFSYFGREVTDEEGKWSDEWSDNTRYPEQIKVSLSRDGGAGELRVPLSARMKK
ncbi:MAG: prepilin-type N-terminal cleavage/methylation domain-containing protein [Thermodesulfobacteriota bacterium]